MSIELFKIFSGPMPEGTKEYTINMDVEHGTLILLDRSGKMVEKTHTGLLWGQAVREIGLVIEKWFKFGHPVETGWAYPATVYGGESLGYFIQGAAKMAKRMSS